MKQFIEQQLEKAYAELRQAKKRRNDAAQAVSEVPEDEWNRKIEAQLDYEAKTGLVRYWDGIIHGLEMVEENLMKTLKQTRDGILTIDEQTVVRQALLEFAIHSTCEQWEKLARSAKEKIEKQICYEP